VAAVRGLPRSQDWVEARDKPNINHIIADFAVQALLLDVHNLGLYAEVLLALSDGCCSALAQHELSRVDLEFQGIFDHADGTLELVQLGSPLLKLTRLKQHAVFL